MPKYAALLYRTEAESPAPGTPESAAVYRAWGAFNQDVKQAGVLASGAGLQPTATATTVRVRGGQTLLTDGPFAETREQLGGILVLECQDLDEALQWASRIPDAATGSIEVRPLWGEEA
jgi:hypothetical protein